MFYKWGITADEAMRKELRQHTLADLAQRITDKAPPAYGVQVVEWLSHSAVNK